MLRSLESNPSIPTVLTGSWSVCKFRSLLRKFDGIGISGCTGRLLSGLCRIPLPGRVPATAGKGKSFNNFLPTLPAVPAVWAGIRSGWHTLCRKVEK